MTNDKSLGRCSSDCNPNSYVVRKIFCPERAAPIYFGARDSRDGVLRWRINSDTCRNLFFICLEAGRLPSICGLRQGEYNPHAGNGLEAEIVGPDLTRSSLQCSAGNR